MGKGDRSRKMRQRIRQRKKKERLKRRQARGGNPASSPAPKNAS